MRWLLKPALVAVLTIAEYTVAEIRNPTCPDVTVPLLETIMPGDFPVLIGL
jgi:hypothetical protein